MVVPPGVPSVRCTRATSHWSSAPVSDGKRRERREPRRALGPSRSSADTRTPLPGSRRRAGTFRSPCRRCARARSRPSDGWPRTGTSPCEATRPEGSLDRVCRAAGPGTSRVPALVPSLTHARLPRTPSSPRRRPLDPTTVSSRGFELALPLAMSLTSSVPFWPFRRSSTARRRSSRRRPRRRASRPTTTMWTGFELWLPAAISATSFGADDVLPDSPHARRPTQARSSTAPAGFARRTSDGSRSPPRAGSLLKPSRCHEVPPESHVAV